MSGEDVPNERMRLRRVRFTAPPNGHADAGPLVIRMADGARLFRRGRLRRAIPERADRIDMAYPAAPAGGLSLLSWIVRWRPAKPYPAHLADSVLCGVPAYLALLPFLLFQAPSEVTRAGLIVGAMLLFIAAQRSENRLRRDENLRIHARLWDRLLRSPPPPAAPDDLSSDARSQAFQLKRALESALAAARELRRIAAGATSMVALLLGLVFVRHSLPIHALLAFPAGALLMGFVVALGRGRLRAQLDLETDQLDRIESRYASRMPLIRQLGLGDSALAELESLGRRQARWTLWAEVARIAEMLLPGVAAAAALVVTIQDRGAQGADLSALLLFIPAVHGAARLGRHAARFWSASRRIAEMKAGLASSIDNDDAEPGAVDEVSLAGIRFQYDSVSRPLIENLSLTLRRGNIVALTGPSGCGKSTLLDILTGLCRPQSGSIWVNGLETPWDSLSGYRTRISRAFQDSQTGSSTIRTAITTNAPDASDADVRRAAEDAGLSSAIAALPMGFETLLVEGAMPASLLHQVQVAQALAQEPDLLILDETLSSLDIEVARGIVAAARRRNIILLYATHREDIAALADRRIELPPSLERNASIAG